MRWTFLVIACVALVSLWGVGPGYALFAAFLVLFANFATFCVLYDRPKDRARDRIAAQFRGLHPHADVSQRLATAPIAVIADDCRLGFGAMTIANLATGVVASGLLIWGMVLRVA